MKLKSFFKSLYIWSVAVISLVVLMAIYIVIWLFTFPFDKRQYVVHKFTQFWATFYVYVYPFWTVKVIGTEKLDRNKACIAVSNHQSMTDIIFLFHSFAFFIWVSKIENFRYPVLGWVMTLNKYISLKRNDPRSFPKMFEDISRALKDNRTIMIFPEGTRSGSLEVGRFKEGAFKAAIDNKVPIIPIAVYGSGKTIKRDPREKGRIKVTVKVMDEVPYESFPSYNPAELKEYIRGLIIKEHETIKASE